MNLSRLSKPERKVRCGVLQGLCWSTELNQFVNNLENEVINVLTKLLTLQCGCKDEEPLKDLRLKAIQRV